MGSAEGSLSTDCGIDSSCATIRKVSSNTRQCFQGITSSIFKHTHTHTEKKKKHYAIANHHVKRWSTVTTGSLLANGFYLHRCLSEGKVPLRGNHLPASAFLSASCFSCLCRSENGHVSGDTKPWEKSEGPKPTIQGRKCHHCHHRLHAHLHW